MNAPLLLAVRGEVHDATIDGVAASVLAWTGTTIAVPLVDSPEGRAFERLREAPATAEELDDIAARAGATGLARWLLWSGRALARGLLVYRVVDSDGATFAEVVLVHDDVPDVARGLPSSMTTTARLQLSRFAMLHRRDGALVLESPLAPVRVELSPPAAALVATFAAARTLDDLAPGETDREAARSLIAVLVTTGILVALGDDGRADEDRDPVLSQWEPHDLVLHTRTRTSGVDAPRGGTFRFADQRPAPPALRHPVGAPAIMLHRPDLDRLIAEDVPFARVMEERASRRRLGTLDAARLGEFLYRTVRVRRQIPAGDDPTAYPRTDRPHPAAGGMHELITYLAIADCDGIPAGLHRYDPVGHGLDPVAASSPSIDRLLDDARAAAAAERTPPVLVILAADFARLSWKYEGIAYELLLKDVGVVLFSMQLVATAMGLGSCPLGGGDSRVFSIASGLPFLDETSVGELMLGS
ncbi:SagB family peptide dehydrogenase [Agromyces sp. NPDC004153]